MLFKKTPPKDNPSKYLYRYYVSTIQTPISKHSTAVKFCLSSLPYSISKPVAAMVIAIFNFSSHSSLVSYNGRSMRLKQVLEAGEKRGDYQCQPNPKRNMVQITVMTHWDLG